METHNKYNQGKIYKIVCNNTGLVYIGSTTRELLCQRLSGHKSAFKGWLKNKNNHYLSSFEVLKGGNYSYVLIEECNCENKDQLHARERYHIDNTICVNLVNPNQTPDEIVEYHKQYYLAKNEYFIEKQKQYDLAHKEYKKEYNRAYYLAKRRIHE